ncbi:hypothetical protein NDU88_008735 [Pleurodeles waltl]|uniref:Uncharacterized protein n=1 Tax=Pleurodeles waltl TaxID=8319 RepID=A0AAV7RWY7_PLEWA|nr:hypothetical protein NDU88_008735 [Pleurodeles waltl]
MEHPGASLNQTRTSLEHKIDKLVVDLTLFLAYHRKLADRTRSLEHTLHDLTPKIRQVETSVHTLLDAALECRAEDKGLSRKNNIRAVNFLEGSDAVSYVERWIRELVPTKALTPFISIERVHRVWHGPCCRGQI